mmetsp:Transcript_49102/g.136484  ORF Transcript_49102/g.136484 Transcript_49102/m.136484 type:complete len:242 (-) Transcript_49102:921-1646(-)
MDPPAGRHAVRHVHELVLLALLAEVLVEVGEGLLLHDLRVDGRDAVHLRAPQDCDVAHADPLERLLLEEAQAPHLRPVTVHLRQLLHEALVDLAHDLQVSRQQLLHHLHGPLLQRLWHHGVVRVVAGAPRQVPSLVPTQLLHVHEEAHHLDHGHRRVGVVHLHGHLRRQLGPLAVRLLDELPEQILERRAHEHVLLLQAQHLALPLVVVRVEHRGEVLCAAPRLDRLRVPALVEGVEVELL